MAKFVVPNLNNVNWQDWNMQLEKLRKYHQKSTHSVRVSISKMKGYDDPVENPDASGFDPEVFYDADDGEGVRPKHLEDYQLEFVAGAAMCAVKEPVDDVGYLLDVAVSGRVENHPADVGSTRRRRRKTKPLGRLKQQELGELLRLPRDVKPLK